LAYLDKWFSFLNDFASFDWILLNDEATLSFNVISKCYRQFISTDATEVDKLFEEIAQVRQTFCSLKGTPFESMEAAQKWSQIFKNSNIVILKTLVSALLSVFCSNAFCESVFSVINSVWTKEKSRLGIDTLNALIAVKLNSDISCADAFDYFLNQKTLLRDAKMSGKYDWCK
jgi:hypothetical protein